MASFMLITEGPTDQEVIESILTGHFGEEPDFPFRRPLRDVTDEFRQGSPGGWERVFEHCEHGEELLREDLQINDYLIIQIDTDCGEERNFGVPPTVNGQDRPVMDIIMDVRKLLLSWARIFIGIFSIEFCSPSRCVRWNAGYCLCT
jgi:hypothetical protein